MLTVQFLEAFFSNDFSRTNKDSNCDRSLKSRAAVLPNSKTVVMLPGKVYGDSNCEAFKMRRAAVVP
jgi:hypothetical protein